MAQDTHRVHWKVVHGTDADSSAQSRDFNSLTYALRFIRDESAASDGTVGEAYARLVTDDESVANFGRTQDGVVIAEDAISLVKDAWTRLDE